MIPTSKDPEHFRGLPSIPDRAGHFDNLVYENLSQRVWVSRMTVADGADEAQVVTIDALREGVWTTQYRSRGNTWKPASWVPADGGGGVS